MSLTPRATKGSTLTMPELDAAFNGLDGRVTTAQSTATSAATAAASAATAAASATTAATAATAAAAAAVPTTRKVGGSALSTDVPLKSVGGISIVGVGDIPLGADAAGITATAYTTIVPLDLVGGRDMGLHVLAADDNFTISGAPAAVANGACVVTIQLASTFVFTFASGISVQGDTVTAEAGRVYEIGLVNRPAGVVARVTKTGFLNSSLPLPGVPTGVTAGTATQSNIPLSWTAPVVDGSHGLPTTYQAQVRTTAGPGAWANYGAAVSHPSTSVDPGGLTASTSYQFQVKAHNSTGDSSYTSAVTASTTAPAVGSITVTPTLSPSAVNLTTGGYQDWVMDSGTSPVSNFLRKGNTFGDATGLIVISATNLSYPGWAHDGTLNVVDPGDMAIGPGGRTAVAFGHDQAAAGDSKLRLEFPASTTTHHAYLWFQPDGTDSMTLRVGVTDSSTPEQVITVPALGTETPRLYAIAYQSGGSGSLYTSLETGSGLSTHSYWMFNSAAYKAS